MRWGLIETLKSILPGTMSFSDSFKSSPCDDKSASDYLCITQSWCPRFATTTRLISLKFDILVLNSSKCNSKRSIASRVGRLQNNEEYQWLSALSISTCCLKVFCQLFYSYVRRPSVSSCNCTVSSIFVLKSLPMPRLGAKFCLYGL